MRFVEGPIWTPPAPDVGIMTASVDVPMTIWFDASITAPAPIAAEFVYVFTLPDAWPVLYPTYVFELPPLSYLPALWPMAVQLLTDVVANV